MFMELRCLARGGHTMPANVPGSTAVPSFTPSPCPPCSKPYLPIRTAYTSLLLKHLPCFASHFCPVPSIQFCSCVTYPVTQSLSALTVYSFIYSTKITEHFYVPGMEIERFEAWIQYKAILIHTVGLFACDHRT